MRAGRACTVWTHLHRCGHLSRVSVVGVGRDLLLLSPPSGVVYLEAFEASVGALMGRPGALLGRDGVTPRAGPPGRRRRGRRGTLARPCRTHKCPVL